MASVEFAAVGKVYPDGTRALEGFDLTIEDGEFVVVLGPSGCGKTTALRMIAGLESVTEGEILINGTVVNELEPRDRDIAMVFQNYALYPHMSVFDNLAFGLRARGVAKNEVRTRITGVAELLGLADLLHRKPKALSGGQRQRVAMGRAIVREPSVFLMDEPLSNLDAKLRVQMRTEILHMQRRLAATTIFVTHDQTEALTMASKVVVMRAGHVQQVGPPGELYDDPGNLFVASFIGSPSMNFLRGRLMRESGKLIFVLGDQHLEIPADVLAVRPTIEDEVGSDAIVGFRPEHARRLVRVDDPGRLASLVVDATVQLTEVIGSEQLVHAETAAKPVIHAQLSDARRELDDPTLGDDVVLSADEEADRVTVVARLDRDHELRIGDQLLLEVDWRHVHFFRVGDGCAHRPTGEPAARRSIAIA